MCPLHPSRVAQTLIVLLVMSFVIYGLIGLMPGDPLDEMIASTPGATPEVIAHLRAIYGLDQPLMLRYWHWLLAALHGDFGFSRSHSQPVLEVLLPALWVTCKLMLTSFVLSVVHRDGARHRRRAPAGRLGRRRDQPRRLRRHLRARVLARAGDDPVFAVATALAAGERHADGGAGRLRAIRFATW